MIQAIGKHVVARAVYPEVKERRILSVNDDKPIHYKVLSVGKEVKEVQVDDLIMPPEYRNQVIEYEGEKLFVFHEDIIICKK